MHKASDKRGKAAPGNPGFPVNADTGRRKSRKSPVKYAGKLFRSGLEQSVYAVKLKVLKQERTALASYPRSGNTWLRFLLESSTGMKCGTIYPEESIMDRPDRGIAIKTHRPDSFKYSRAIHLVRHPLDVLDSYFRWKRDYAHQTAQYWERFAGFRIAQWVRHTEHWLAVPYETFLLRYEDLLMDPEGWLTELLTWLGNGVDRETIRKAVGESNLDRLREKVPEREARLFFRRGGAGKSLDRYSPELLAVIGETAAVTMKKLGYALPDCASGEPWFHSGRLPGPAGGNVPGERGGPG